MTTPRLILPALAVLLCLAAAPAAAQLAHQETVNGELFIGIELYSGFRDTVRVFGPCEIAWSDPIFADPGWMIETEIVAMDLVSSDPPVLVRGNMSGLPTPGEIEFPPPDPDFPAESFFDVFFEIELPEELPGLILTNDVPLRIETTVRQFPPFFDRYAPASPAPVPLFDQYGGPVGEVTWWRQETLPWSPPQAHLLVPTVYASDEAQADETGLVHMSAFLTNGPPPGVTEFFWRPGGSFEPWIPFALDDDGSDYRAATVFDAGEGDGYAATLDANLFDPFGSYVDLKVEFDGGAFADSSTIWLDPTPLRPEIVSSPPGSLMVARLGELLRAIVRILDEQSQQAQMWVLPIAPDYSRTLETIDQLGLSGETPTKLDSASCGPTAGASCLKWLADNGHPALEHPNGDGAKPEQTGAEVARELRGDVGTTGTAGTSTGGMVAGITSYLARHGQTGWDVSYHEVNNYDDVAAMFNEFESDNEDVIPLFGDSVQTPTGKKPRGHFVTLGSKGSHCYEVNTPEYSAYCVKYGLDFMDPWNGGSTADNNYPVGTDSQGRPVLEGYKIGDGPTRVQGYVKVSPPSDGGGSRAAVQAPSAGGWILVDGAPASGGGLLDTLVWDTTGFGEGVYLVKFVAVDASGRTSTVFKLGGIPEWTVTGSDDRPPLPRSGIRGSWPNPFNPATTIEFYVAKKQAVAIAIHDAAGRLVRRLAAGEVYEEGIHRLVWDGAGENGRPVASGVYFCRFESGGASHARKLVLLR
ncbi:MAG: T9SS type A sorting domain-containing protein [Candidatus Krumholzibacteriota bacterium]|nr:T9SS type A sorting domain-containing protein [Candidatus Krumholzibacteriota bacterium]